MLRFNLTHYGTGSVITCSDDLRHIGAITYTRKIHRYESDSDYKTINTELVTYGDKTAYEIFNYFQQTRQPDLYRPGNTRLADLLDDSLGRNNN